MLHESSLLLLVPVVAAAPRAIVSTVTAAPHAGPGWFDSSWDLRRGLEVREGGSGEDRLHDWIDDYLRAQRDAGRTASPSASTAIA